MVSYAVKDDSRIKPNKIKADIGDKVHIECKSAGDTKWFFAKDTIPITPLVIARSVQTFTVADIEWDNDGIYYCYGLHPSGNFHFLDEVWLYIYGEYTSSFSGLPLIIISSVDQSLVAHYPIKKIL